MKRRIAILLTAALALSLLSGCGQSTSGSETKTDDAYEGAVKLVLSDNGITVDGEAASTDESAAVYTANDIVYYEDGHDFTYGAGSENDAHSAEEAAAHTVVHITQSGTYVLSGKLSAGQIAVDLGKEAKTDPEAVVTLVLNGVDITCTVAPAVIFYKVYECDVAFVDYDENDTETYEAAKDVDTSAAGANVIIADGTTNNVTGSYVAKIYKEDTVELSADGTKVKDAKKRHKYDGAFYSKMSMNIHSGADGTGVLNIVADNEGLDSELHLTLNGGIINIFAGNDGINTNEDNVSVTAVNGGELNVVVTGETGEGDGIDSNGWLVINGGIVTSYACSDSMDSGLDADMGIHINGGTVIAAGNMYDRIDESAQNYAVFSFAQRQSGGTAYTLKNTDSEAVMEASPVNDFQYLIISAPELEEGNYTLWQGETQLAGSEGGGFGMGGPGMGGMTPPDGMEPPEGMGDFDPANIERPEPPQEGTERPDDGRGPGGNFQPEMNEDGTITLPDGSTINPADMTPPDGGFGGRRDTEVGELSTVFSITSGGTMFSGVTPAQ